MGCQWGDGSQPVGNWAPINLGVGQVNGKWLSIFQNSPTTNKKLDFNVKITGDNLSGDCRYENGKFYSDTTSNDSGCTVRSTPPDQASRNLLTQFPTDRSPLWRCLLRLLLEASQPARYRRDMLWSWPGSAADEFAAHIKISQSASFLQCILCIAHVTWRSCHVPLYYLLACGLKYCD